MRRSITSSLLQHSQTHPSTICPKHNQPKAFLSSSSSSSSSSSPYNSNNNNNNNNDNYEDDFPKPRRHKWERKPYPTPMKLLIQRAKQEKETRKAHPCRMLPNPPDNGLLVPGLVPVAHRVYRAHQSLLSSLPILLRSLPLLRCRFCAEVHIGHVGHEIRTCDGPGSGSRRATHVWSKGGVKDVITFPKCFHLYDRVGKPRVGHDERRDVPRIPAIAELCSQAGVDLVKHPTKRRTKPVYSIEGRIVDFEQVAGNDESSGYLDSCSDDSIQSCGLNSKVDEASGVFGLEENCGPVGGKGKVTDYGKVSIRALESWFEMVRGTKKIMEQYTVWTCGYCPEVQVGPKGHRVRMCKATKHQARDGQHAWQEATIDDIVVPNYVWHVRDPNGPPLNNKLKRFYGKAPAVVELCVQAGAPVPVEYRSMMRLDVVPPSRDEVDLVA